MEPTKSTQGYRCKKCDKPFTIEVIMPLPIDAYIKHIKKLKCPLCGAKSKDITLGQHLTEEENLAILENEGAVDSTIEVRAALWLERGEVGASSKCIADFMQGKPGLEVNWPYDPDDFRRCVLLLKLIPEWNSRIPEMSVLGGGWTNLAPRWSEVEISFTHEMSKGNKAPETYELIKQLLTI